MTDEATTTVTADEQIQAKEFLKRAEIRTMRKDLQALREVDALKERDKIAKIKTLEEQLAASKEASLAQKGREEKASAKAELKKEQLEEVLMKNENQEKIAEKDLKNYATEPERQQIFLLESQRFGFEKEVEQIDLDKNPVLKLEKNKLLIQRKELEEKLNAILEQEKKLEQEQKFIIEKEQTSSIALEKKTLEQSRWDLDKKIQEVEKKRWEVEKQIQALDTKLAQIDKTSEQFVIEKNGLQDKILGIDKSLRELYSAIMVREEEKRKGLAKEQLAKKEVAAKERFKENEETQRQQWAKISIKQHTKDQQFSKKISGPTRENLIRTTQIEEDQRKKFIQDIEEMSQKEEKKIDPATLSVPKKVINNQK